MFDDTDSLESDTDDNVDSNDDNDSSYNDSSGNDTYDNDELCYVEFDNNGREIDEKSILKSNELNKKIKN